MKKIIFNTLLLVGMTSNIVVAQDAYYWYKGKKVSLSKNESKKFVVYTEGSLERRSSITNLEHIRAKGIHSNPAGTTPYKASKTLKGRWAVIESESTAPLSTTDAGIAYEAPFYKKAQTEVAISDLFYVKLKSVEDLNKLEKLAARTNTEIVGQNTFMPEWYTLAAHKNSKGNALEVANIFYESGFFSEATPDFMQDYGGACVNDTYFPQQWNLKNTGQTGTSGNDIRACEAWATTTGSPSVVIAVLDQGIQLNHPDIANLVSQSYDTHTGSSPSQIRGNHGTACAGIAGATRNNSKGVSGVAPGCKLMSISDSLTFTPDASQRLANGINFAWQNGASVISNSWAGASFQSPLLDDAITKALTLGRGGLGTIVVFAAGNQDEEVRYPANSNPDILAVGAASPCGERKSPISCDGNENWGSNSGPELDLMAPGVLIPTTDRTGSVGYTTSDYYPTFGGTSAATPHVAGVAALILSVNPNLTRKQVNDIIESTTRKTGGYTYANTSGRPNGTWTWEAGYGFLDANAAVLKAKASIVTYLTKFSAPRTSALPSLNKQFSKVHVLGTGGPNLSGFTKSVFNWNLSQNQLYQFSLERNASPYYTELKNFSTYIFNQAQPKIVINSTTGWTGLAGTYYINNHSSNIVLVEQTGKYAIYFSNSTTPPNVRLEELMEEIESETIESLAYPNPFVSSTTIELSEPSSIMVVNSKGETIEQLEASENVVLGASYPVGLYLVKVASGTRVRKYSIIKE